MRHWTWSDWLTVWIGVGTVLGLSAALWWAAMRLFDITIDTVLDAMRHGERIDVGLSDDEEGL